MNNDASNEKIHFDIEPDVDPFNHAQFEYSPQLIEPINDRDTLAINSASQWIKSDDANKVFKLPAPNWQWGQYAIQDDIDRTCYLAGLQAREIQSLLTSQKNLLSLLESIRAGKEFGQPIPLKFKIWRHDSEVTIDLNKLITWPNGKSTLEFLDRGETEEGYHSSLTIYTIARNSRFEVIGVTEEHQTYGRDCDGKHSSESKRFCPAELLTAGTNGHPMWQPQEYSERDFSAETAGY